MHSKFSLKPLNDKTWILLEDGERQSLVSQLADGSVMLFGKINHVYSSMHEFKQNFQKITIEEPHTPETEKEQGNVEGFPVKHATWYNTLKDPLPSYTRTENSQIRYAAGYYALKFPNGWSASFCPKLTTLSEHEYAGPFTTKIEMQLQISSKNKSIEI